MNNINVSRRITAISERVKGDVLADIACDRAYISITAVLLKKAKKAAACDISPAAVKYAKDNIAAHGLNFQIEAFVSDGLTELNPAFFDCAVLAGIGGRLTREILFKDKEKTLAFKHFILEPQSEVFIARRALHELGFIITADDIIKDKGFYYPIIEAKPGVEEPYTDTEYLYGKLTLEQKNPLLTEFLVKEKTKTENLLNALPNGKKSPRLNEKLQSITNALSILC